MTVTSELGSRKEVRLAVRLTPEDDALIRDAAAVMGQSLTDFVTSAAVARAEDSLVDRRLFRLDNEAWAEFMAILDRPARPIPELVAVLGQRAPWDNKTE